MADKKENKQPHELPFGKQMTSLLIVKNMRSKPKEVFKGVAFVAFLCFFVFSAFGRSCQQQKQQEQEESRFSQSAPVVETWKG